MEDPISEIKKSIKENKAVIGTDETMKALRQKALHKAYLSSNCPKSVREDMQHYGKLAECAIEELDVPNDELGVLCKKPFSISVVGIKA